MRRLPSIAPLRRAALALAALAPLALLGVPPFGAASAQERYPVRPVTIVVPFGPGSGSDTVTRLLGQRMGEARGQPVVIENRGGANGAIAANAVARARPDGYTFLVGTNSSHGSNPSLMKALSYDPIKDFLPVGRVGVFTYFVVADPALPIRTIGDLVARARAAPQGGAAPLGMATGNTTSIVMGETFVRRLGLDPLRVPYRAVPQALTDIVGGRVGFMFADISSSIGLVQAGSLRALAVTSAERSALLPDLPTIRETVLPDFLIESWIGLFAPADTPPAIAARVAAELDRALADPAIARRLGELGVEPRPLSGPAFAGFVADEIAKWTALVQAAGIQPE